jgi:hypothetical protein
MPIGGPGDEGNARALARERIGDRSAETAGSAGHGGSGALWSQVRGIRSSSRSDGCF